MVERVSQFSQNLADIRKRRDDVNQRLKEVAQAFNTLTDPAPHDYSDYIGERLARLASRIPGLTLTVPPCDWSHGEIQELRAQNGTLIVLLPEMTLPVLAQMHPNLAGHWTVQPSSGIESDLHYGWLAIEDVTESPNLRSNEEDLRIIAQKTGKSLMMLRTYYVGSMDHYDRTGKYFDHDFQTASRLGSRYGGSLLDAGFYSNGRPHVHLYLLPGNRHGYLGGRFEGVKK